jgi:hypothetical protein
MDFIKKHYEKIILSAVLLGLVGWLLVLPFLIEGDRERTNQIETTIINSAVKPLALLDLTQQSNVLVRLQSPVKYDFSTTNKLFNPVEWQRTMDGRIVKASGIGPQAAVVTQITPLYFILTLDSVEPSNEFSSARYVISVERQAAANPAMRRQREHYVSVGDKTDDFTVLAAQGAPNNPSGLVLKLIDGETVTISKKNSFRRVDAYMADLKYDPERRTFTNLREGSVISFGGENYIIVAIHQDEVILSAASNQKRTTLRYAP